MCWLPDVWEFKRQGSQEGENEVDKDKEGSKRRRRSWQVDFADLPTLLSRPKAEGS